MLQLQPLLTVIFALILLCYLKAALEASCSLQFKSVVHKRKRGNRKSAIHWTESRAISRLKVQKTKWKRAGNDAKKTSAGTSGLVLLLGLVREQNISVLLGAQDSLVPLGPSPTLSTSPLAPRGGRRLWSPTSDRVKDGCHAG